ncbi:MAG: DUF4910 domain-containing protein [Methylacidiphilales bacterium]|nr:DUF4910 domain-containing protein [Candidatus Methylacidiphilales bacterium]
MELHLPVALPPGASMEEMIDAVWRLPRDIVSSGYDAALAALAGQVPMTIHSYPTGTECWTWIIPEKWTCREARLETLDGRVVFSTADNPLHIASYSHPFAGEVDREELLAHLRVHPTLPDAVPYHFLLYRRDWGLCCSRATRDTLTDPRYRVVIDAAFSFGALAVGEVTVEGERDDCIVLCAHLDHRAQVNDGLAGVVAGIEIMRALRGRSKPHFTYRLLIVSETIGSIAFLSHHEHLIPKMRGGMFLEMVGLDYPLALQHSFDPDSTFDRTCRSVLSTRDPQLRTGRFLEIVTNDERQFNSPGVRVPMVSISRVKTPCGPTGVSVFDEYHSELDAPGLNSSARLRDTCDAVLAIIDAWESNYVPVPRFRGEVFLSRFGISYDYEVDPHYGQALFEVMHALDGRRSVVDIAHDTGRPFTTVLHVVKQFRAAGLVTHLDA